MGSFFTVVDDPDNSRVVLTRTISPHFYGMTVIWLDADPSGTGVTTPPFPGPMSKVDMGSAKNTSQFFIAYKASP